MFGDRGLNVLRAIVSQYVCTREPVGSKAISSTYDLGVSSATIRNDMAALEEQGLIYQPHTSAGRVPTDKGYRVFVDFLMESRPLNRTVRRTIDSFLSDTDSYEEIIERTARLLSQATRQVAVVQYPSMPVVTVRSVDLVDLDPTHVLLIVISHTGYVEQRMLELSDPVNPDSVKSLRARLNESCENQSVGNIKHFLAQLETPSDPLLTELVTRACEGLLDLFEPKDDPRFVTAGISNLARSGGDFPDIGALIDALEEQMVFPRLFSQPEHFEPHDVHVSIGSENEENAFIQASVVSGTYSTDKGYLAHLGIIGPTCMDYSRTMSTVCAVSAYLTTRLSL